MPLRKLELKTALDVSHACDPGNLVYAKRLYNLYREVQSRRLPVFELAYGCFAVPFDCMQLLK